MFYPSVFRSLGVPWFDYEPQSRGSLLFRPLFCRLYLSVPLGSGPHPTLLRFLSPGFVLRNHSWRGIVQPRPAAPPSPTCLVPESQQHCPPPLFLLLVPRVFLRAARPLRLTSVTAALSLSTNGRSWCRIGLDSHPPLSVGGARRRENNGIC